jgi:site-specific DNA-methyltransferase (adenine-specific)
MGVAIADAGFEIRDMISWLYFSGFPKSHDVSKGIDRHLGADRPDREVSDYGSNKVFNASIQVLNAGRPATPEAQKWEGWGTALKPSYEPAILARKPLEKGLSVAENVLKHGTGAINIDACRFAYGDPCWVGPQEDHSSEWDRQQSEKSNISYVAQKDINLNSYTPKNGRWPANIYQCPKASRSEREAGLEHLQGKSGFEAVDRNEGSAGLDNPRAGAGRTADHVKNFHPTVKPIGVMRWLCRLITPPNGTVLDPFLGSGTTAVAACLEGFDAIGCEMTEEYYPIIEGRIEWAKREREHGPKE